MLPTPTTIMDRIRHNILFENVSDNDFELIRTKLIEQNVGADSVIVPDNGTGETLYLIAAGRVKIVKKTREGQETLLALLHHGDCFGELELIDGRPRSACVVALEDCTIYQLRKPDFEMLLHNCPPFTARLMQLLSVRLRAANFHFISELDRHESRYTLELKKLEQLIEATKILNSTLDLDRLLEIILDTALSIVDGDRGTLYLLDAQRGELWSKIFKGDEIVEFRLPVGKGIAGYVAATGETINIADAYLDNRFDPEFDGKTGYRTQTMLCMPMRDKTQKIIGVIQLLNKADGLFTKDDENFINALSIHSSIAIENARLYESERQKIALEKDLKAAHEVQRSLLPKLMPKIDGYDIAGTSIPAQVVGGDYFDFIPVGANHIAICLGDVSGKGLPASLLMANLQATLRSASLSNPGTAEWVQRSNTLLYHNTNSDKFVTLFFSILDPGSHTLSYTNAGHDHPFLFSHDREPVRLKVGGIVVSIMEEYPYKEDTVPLAPGDVLVLNSDGVTEAFNARNIQFGEKRLRKVIEKNLHLSAQEIIDAILKAIKKHTGQHPQFDDITLVVVKRKETGKPGKKAG